MKELLKKRYKRPGPRHFTIVAGCFLTLLLFSQAFAAQPIKSVKEASVKLEVNNANLFEVLANIEAMTDYSFSYRKEDLNSELLFTGSYNQVTVAEILMEISKRSGLKFRQVNNNIYISKSKSDSDKPLEIIIDGIKVTGRVVSSDDDSDLPGVNVIVKGTANGTITDIDGNYSIEVPDREAILVFSSVGYIQEEVLVGDNSVIDMRMTEDITALDEIVVVGYGTQQKREVVSAISTIGADEISKTTTTSFTQALQGAAPGLQMSSSSGAPNAAVRILIRGTGSINTSAEPLILVDGLPVASGGTNPLDYINPTDIESVSVLKDAAATSIYGSRGANGVILITTKTGSKSKGGTLTFGYEHGFTQPINQVELADADEWRAIVQTGRENGGLGGVRFEKELDLEDPRHQQRFVDLDMYNQPTTDWVDLYSRNGRIDAYSFSAANSSERTNFFISAQYRDQTGNIINERYKRFVGRINFDYRPVEYLNLGVRYSIVHQDEQRIATLANSPNYEDRYLNYGAHAKYGTLYSSALPIYPQQWPDNGAPFDPLSGNNLTYSADRDNSQDDIRELRNIGTVFMDLKPLKGLTLHAEYGMNILNRREDIFTSGRLRNEELLEADRGNPERELLDYIWENGVSRFTYTTQQPISWNTNATATYQTNIADQHAISLLVGVEALLDKGETHVFEMEGASSVQREDEFGAFIRDPNQFLQINHFYGGDQRFFSYFSRFNYDFQEKYLLQATLRRDGSSNFTPDDRFSWFPSISAGWVMSDEQFMDSYNWLELLKLRTSYGVTGNANIGRFLYLDGFVLWPNYPNIPNAATQENVGSRSIQWEKSSTFDAAFEFGLFNNRLSGSIGYYRTITSNLLMNFPTAASIGIYATNNINVTALANVGKIQNQGMEFELQSINVNSGQFQWTTNFNFTTNKNKVLELYPGFDGNPTQLSFGNKTTVQIGEPMGTYFLPTFGGYDEFGNPLIKEINQELAQDQVYEYTGENVRPIGSVTNDNRVIQYGKTGLPTWFGGLTNTFSYKGLSLSVLLTFQGGHYLYDNDNSLRRVGLGRSVYRKGLLDDAWSPSNTDALYPVLSWNNLELNPIDPNANAQVISDESTNYLEKGDFMRIRTISVSYDLPSEIAGKAFMKGIRVYANLNNVGTITGFKAYDPEVVNTSGDAQSRNIGQGIINGVPYFQVFSANFGVNLTF